MASFGEGGFMTDGAAADEGGKKGGKGFQPTRFFPVTCKQLINATADGDRFLIDGKEANNVTLVGQMAKCTVQANNITVTIDDGTGLIDVMKWLDPTSPEAETVKELCSNICYLRVYGNLQAFEGRRRVTAPRIQAVNDFNEITFHMLQCIVAHLANTRGPLTASVQAPSGSFVAASETGISFPSNIHHMVYNTVRANSSENGIDLHEICMKLAGVATEGKVNEAVQYFLGSGIFYFGKDNSHYRCD